MSLSFVILCLLSRCLFIVGIDQEVHKDDSAMDEERVRHLWMADATKGLFAAFYNPHSNECMNAGSKTKAQEKGEEGEEEVEEDESWEEEEDQAGDKDVEEPEDGTTGTTASIPSVQSKRRGGGNGGMFPWKPKLIAGALCACVRTCVHMCACVSMCAHVCAWQTE